MVRTFLQVAAGAADIPVTRLLGQSPAGLSATGEADTRNTYDMIAARQELELRPALERLDRLIAASEGLDPDALTFAFRPLWQLDAATAATVALQRAQVAQIYAGLNLWPTATTARLVQAQLAEDGTYPNAAATFGEGRAAGVGDAQGIADMPVASLGSTPNETGLPHYVNEPRDWHGRWTAGASEGSALPGILPVVLRTGGNPEITSTNLPKASSSRPSGQTLAEGVEPDEENRREDDPFEREPGDVLLIQRYEAAAQAL